jgi:immune inhibitor A
LIDPISGRKADGYGVELIDNGPIWFDPWAGVDAEVSVDSTSVELGLSIHFDSSESFSYHLDGTPNDYTVLWDFDDDTYSTSLTPSHVFDTPGIYDVSLRVEAIDTELHPGIMYDWDNVTINVFQPGTPLSCSADGSNLGGYEGIRNTKIQFFGSVVGGNPPYSFNWIMGDGTTITEQNPIHLYSESGIYAIILTVTDNVGTTVSDTAEVNVLEPSLLETSITTSSTNILIGESVTLSGSASGGLKPYTYIWTINGEEITGKTITYTFSQKGIYTANLNVIDYEGTTTTSSVEIIVGDIDEIPPEILKVVGGFGLSAQIKTNNQHVESSIIVNGTVWWGGSEIANIPKHTTQTVKLPFTFGLGKVAISVTANEISKEYSAFLLGPFFLNIQEF